MHGWKLGNTAIKHSCKVIRMDPAAARERVSSQERTGLLKRHLLKLKVAGEFRL